MSADPSVGARLANAASTADERSVTAGCHREVTVLPDGRRLTLYSRRPKAGSEPAAEAIER